MWESNFQGMRVTVMGLGRFGGGVGVVRFLAERGAEVTITDTATEESLADSLAQLDDVPLAAVHLGGHREDDFRRTDLVVANPAVRRDHQLLQLARYHGVSITSEMNLFWQIHRGRVIGVTGSNGKSTTSAMIHSILQAAGFPSRLGGNIGNSLLPVVDQIQPHEWIVLELSSFQLADLDAIFASPTVAVVTNFSPNHLDWHGSLDEYRRAKQTILRWQCDDSIAVLNRQDEDLLSWKPLGRRLDFGRIDLGDDGLFEFDGEAVFRRGEEEQRFPLADWAPLPGAHNLQNALAAACTAMAIGADVSSVQQGLKNYEPLPHRLQLVGEIDGRQFYNDSLATTPESAICALESFERPVVLLAGGYDKQVDLSEFATAIANRTKAVALMGKTAGLLGDLLRSQSPVRKHHEFRRLEDAFRWAVEQSETGDVVLLSPGCASYDLFPNFVERGHRFTELVKECNLAKPSA